MVKIMHIADVHLDRKTEGLSPEKSALRRAEYKETFEKAINLAKEEDVKIILIAGDLFDSALTADSTVDFVRKTLVKIPEIYVFISPGNHDPIASGIYSRLGENLSENVKIFGTSLECVELDALNVRVIGAGFDGEYQENCLLSGFSAPDDGKINLVCIHGDLKSGSEYNPLLQSDISGTNADYIALGHTHAYSGILTSGKTHYAYSGALEPHGFDETGEKGVLIGNIDKQKADLKFVPLEKRRFNVCEIDVSDCEIFEDVIGKIREKLTRASDFYKIVLTGGKKAEIKLDKAVLNSFFEDSVFYIKFSDETKSLLDIDALCEEYTLKGIFAKRIKELSDGGNKEFYDKVADYLFGLF